jgi:isocitrate lyase
MGARSDLASPEAADPGARSRGRSSERAQVAENAPEGYYALRRAVQQAIEAARAQIDEDGRPRGLNP